MSDEFRDADGVYGSKDGAGPGPAVLSASTLNGDDVYNRQGEKLGSIKEIMLNVQSGKVCYAVLSYGGFLTMGEKLFAVPWSALTLETENKRFVLDVAADRLKDAPGFDNDRWPDMADATWAKGIDTYYEVQTDATRLPPPMM